MNKVESRPYTVFVRDKSNQVELERKCFQYILNRIAWQKTPPPNVWELFGGIGLFASLVQPLWRNENYTSWDNDSACVKMIHAKYPHINARQCDSFNSTPPDKCDIITADFNSFTLLKFVRQPQYYHLVTRIFSLKAQWIQITDSAINKLHLNKSVYSTVLKKEVSTLSDYIAGLTDTIAIPFGYNYTACVYHFGASYILFERGKPTLEPIPPYKVKKD